MNLLSHLIHAIRSHAAWLSFKQLVTVVTTTTSAVDIWLQRLEKVPYWMSSTKYPPGVVRTSAWTSIKQKNFQERSLKGCFFVLRVYSDGSSCVNASRVERSRVILLPRLLTFVLDINWSTCRKALQAWGDGSTRSLSGLSLQPFG